jgi:hypothetical protein
MQAPGKQADLLPLQPARRNQLVVMSKQLPVQSFEINDLDGIHAQSFAGFAGKVLPDLDF